MRHRFLEGYGAMGQYNRFGYEPRGAKLLFITWFAVEVLLLGVHAYRQLQPLEWWGYVQYVWLVVLVLLCFGVAFVSARASRRGARRTLPGFPVLASAASRSATPTGPKKD